jgi:single-strand DNA-binding protein
VRSIATGCDADYEHATIVAHRIDPPGRRDYRPVPEDAAMSVNKVLLIGNLGKDPEVRFTGGGQAVARFPVATSEVWNDREGQRQERTEWHNVVVWGKQGETCGQYLQKGRQVYIEGSIRTRQYDDKDGNKRYITEVIAQRVQFLGGRGGDAPARGGGRDQGSEDMPPAPLPEDDDIPF